MKLLVGLGNPGRDYQNTRHNVGYEVVDVLTRRHAPAETGRGRFHALTYDARIAGEKCLLMRPTTYMNRSGVAVAEAASFYRVNPASDLLVIVDDLALTAGGVRLRARGGAGGHNGLADIERVLGTTEYPRLRIGIGPKPPGMDQARYVLDRFNVEQREAIEPALARAADAAEMFVSDGIVAAMNEFNAREKPEMTDETTNRGDGVPRAPDRDSEEVESDG